MFIISILSRLLMMIIVVLLRYVFLGLNLKCFLCLRNFLHMLKLNFKLVLKSFALTGGVHMSYEFQEYLQQKGILSQQYCPNTP